jgi:hypothetical protein
MEEVSSKIRNKKRLMFISGEDFYLMAYSIIIILKTLGCEKDKKVFKDHRKLPFLISLVGNSGFRSIWIKLSLRNNGSNAILSMEERKILLDAYYWSIGKEPTIKRLLIRMEKNGIVNLVSSKNKMIFDISLNEHAGVRKILNCDLYEYETENFKEMIRVVKRLNILTLDSFVEKVFYEFEIGKCLI